MKTSQWMSTVERLTFGLSESSPVCVINHRWTDAAAVQYDMHFGVEVGVILEGHMHRRWHGHEMTISKGQAWLCGMWEPHGFELLQTPCRAVVFMIFPPMLVNAVFHEDESLNLMNVFEVGPSRRPQISPKYKQRLCEICEDVYSVNEGRKLPGGKIFWRVKLLEILLLLADGIERAGEISQQPLDSFSRINPAIQKVFSSRQFISAEEAAELCRMHRNTFRKAFQNLMGIGFSEFSLRYRLRLAADALAGSDMPVKAIASEYGFTDTSHFHRTFKSHYHQSPTMYRATAIKK